VKLYRCLKNLKSNWESWRTHHFAHDAFDAFCWQEIARPNSDTIAVRKKRREEWHPDNVVEMAVRKENVEIEAFLVSDKSVTKPSQSSPGIEDDNTFAAANLDAGRVSAITDCVRSWTGDASPDTPKPDPH
jgi:hypothetical protein